MFPSYAELHCLTNFTFLRGASHPEELVERAARLGYSALAITDECSLAGVVRAHVAAKEHGHQADRRRRAGRLRAVRRETSTRASRLTRNDARCASCSSPPTAQATAISRELITRAGAARRRANTISPQPISNDGVPGCLALLLPGAEPDLDHARWLGSRFRGALLDRSGAAVRPRRPRAARAARNAMHRKPACRWSPPATCTCTCARAARCRTPSPPSASACPVGRCRPRAVSQRRALSALARAAGAPLSARAADRDARCRRALSFLPRQLALRVPRGDRAGGRDAGELAAQADRGRIQVAVRVRSELAA